jgi:hypothetical protein
VQRPAGSQIKHWYREIKLTHKKTRIDNATTVHTMVTKMNYGRFVCIVMTSTQKPIYHHVVYVLSMDGKPSGDEKEIEYGQKNHNSESCKENSIQNTHATNVG